LNFSLLRDLSQVAEEITTVSSNYKPKAVRISIMETFSPYDDMIQKISVGLSD